MNCVSSITTTICAMELRYIAIIVWLSVCCGFLGGLCALIFMRRVYP